MRDRILDAAVDIATIHGIAKLSVGDVARKAHISRATLYKHFASKQALVDEAVLRDAGHMVERVANAIASVDDARLALEAGMLVALRLTREHPLLDRLVRVEPEALLPILTSEESPVLRSIRLVVEPMVDDKVPNLSPMALRRLADVLTRLLISYAINAPDDPPEVVAEFVARFLADGVVDNAVLQDRSSARS